jgi:hypothetical protein
VPTCLPACTPRQASRVPEVTPLGLHGVRASAHRGGLNRSAQHFLIRRCRGGCDGTW